jgi:acyl-coenzyme A synthetase/AMP-(fatty) acid ligase
MERLSSGAVCAHGRIDDTMNLNGMKVSSAELEAACNAAHDTVLETAAVGVPPPGGGPEKLHVFVVFKPPTQENPAPSTKQLKILFNKSLGQRLGPGYYAEDVHEVEKLPRTASNKVMRRVLRDEFRPTVQ